MTTILILIIIVVMYLLSPLLFNFIRHIIEKRERDTVLKKEMVDFLNYLRGR